MLRSKWNDTCDSGLVPSSWNWVPKAKNVVLDAVLLTEVLEEATGFRVVHEVSLYHDVSRTFIRVQTPASIAERLDVMDMVVVHNGAGLNAKRVDPPISDVTRCPIVYK